MPSELKRYKVFIASPGGVERERKAFYSVVNQYSNDEATHRGVFFEPCGWEKVNPGMGRPQSILNEELKECDFFVLLIHNRWGTHPGENQHGASSGTEEEFEVALDCYHDKKRPMRELACFFKALSTKKLADPDSELQKVLYFKIKIESEKILLHKTFSSIEEFKTMLRSTLAEWLREISEKVKPGAVVIKPDKHILSPSIIDVIQEDESVTENLSNKHVEKAWALVHKGRLTEAEIEFSKAIGITSKPYQLLCYANFLIESGQIRKALRLIDISLQESLSDKRLDRLANTLTLKSRVYYLQGKISEAEKLNKEALSYYLDIEYYTGIATVYQNLGKIFLNKGQLQEAENMFLKALDVHKKDPNESRRADIITSLGAIFRIKGELTRAEKLFKEAYKIHKGLKQPSAEADNISELGKIKLTKGKNSAAIRFITKSLKIYEMIGNKMGMADQNGNLGNIYLKMNKIDLAEGYYQKSLVFYRQLGKQVGIATSLGNLGIIHLLRNEEALGEGLFQEALSIFKDLNDKRGIANQYQNLGLIYFNRKELEIAEKYSKDALKIWIELADNEMIAKQLINVADVFYQRSKFEEARDCCLKALEISKHNGYKEIQKLIEERLD